MVDINSLVAQVNRIRWREESAVTSEATALIQCHVERIQPVVQHVMRATGKPVSEAHGVALTPAYSSPEYGAVFDALSDQGDFTNAVARGPVIMTLTAAQVWHLDPGLSQFPNPWLPLADLCSLGYPVSYDDDPDMTSVHLLVGLRDGIARFPVC